MALDMTVAAPSGVTFKTSSSPCSPTTPQNQPRSQQRRPDHPKSGIPALRKLAYGLTLAPRCNDRAGDPLPSMVGTGAHAQMEDVLAGYNDGTASASSSRTVSNPHRVSPGRWTPTTCARPCRDRLEVPRHHQDEHCPPRPAPRNSLRGAGPSLRARRPARRTHPRIVRIAFIPRAGFSTNTYVWEVPWNPEIAMAAINRMTSTIAMAADLQVDRHPDRYAVFPATPFQCDYCPGTTSNPPDRTRCAGGDEGLRRRPLTPSHRSPKSAPPTCWPHKPRSAHRLSGHQEERKSMTNWENIEVPAGSFTSAGAPNPARP